MKFIISIFSPRRASVATAQTGKLSSQADVQAESDRFQFGNKNIRVSIEFGL